MPSSAPPSSSAPTRRQTLCLVSLAVGASLAGCDSLPSVPRGRDPSEADRQVAPDWEPAPGQWPLAHYSYKRTKYNDTAKPPKSEPTPLWQYDISDENISSLVVAEEMVYVRTDGALVALDASDGSERWRRPRNGRGGLQYVAGRLYDSRPGELSALTPDGTESWTATLGDQPSYVLEREGWVFVPFRGRLLGLHADTGDVVTEAELDALGPATAGGSVYAGRFALSAYDVVDGEFVDRWMVDTQGPYESYGPAVVPGPVVYRSERALPWADVSTGRFVAHDAADGSRRFTLSFEHTPFSPAVADGTAYVTTSLVTASALGNDGKLAAIAESGDVRWRFDPATGLRPPVVGDGTVYTGPFVNQDAPLVALDADTGDERWERDVDGTPELALAGEVLYVGESGCVTALVAKA